MCLLSLVLVFVDNRSEYLSQTRYYASLAVTPIHLLANLPSRLGLGLGSFFQEKQQLRMENRALQDELLATQVKLQKYAHLEAENQRLNDLLKASSVVDEEKITVRAQLINASPDPFSKRVLINKGSRDGVFIGQPVVDAFGFMGQVIEVEMLTSWVLLISDPQHHTPVQVNRNGIRAIATGTADSLHQLTLENVTSSADIVVGDVLVTSGLDQRFPVGYPVGVVSQVQTDSGGTFANILVTPTAQLDRSRNVLLLFDNPNAPKMPLVLPELSEPVQTLPASTPAIAVPLADLPAVAESATEAQATPQ